MPRRTIMRKIMIVLKWMCFLFTLFFSPYIAVVMLLDGVRSDNWHDLAAAGILAIGVAFAYWQLRMLVIRGRHDT